MYLGLQSVVDAALLVVMSFIDPRAARVRLLLAECGQAKRYRIHIQLSD